MNVTAGIGVLGQASGISAAPATSRCSSCACTCLGILRSFRGLDTVRLEAVSARALELGVLNCKGVAAPLARKPDDAPTKTDHPVALLDHANLRGPGYYH